MDFSFLQGLSNFSLFGFSSLDIIIVFIVLFYAYEGYQLGFILAFLDFVSFITSFVIALKFYSFLADLLFHYFNMPIGFANAIGFFIIALFVEVILNILLRTVIYRQVVPKPGRNKIFDSFRKADHILGIVPGTISAFVIISFLLSLIVALPASPLFKILVTKSHVGSLLVNNTAAFEGRLNDIFGGALHETMSFLTVEPKSNESIALHFIVSNGTVDEAGERQMFQMVNKERTSRGFSALALDTNLRKLARGYSNDMFMRGYFSHYNPEGKSPFDRMGAAGILYSAAGENLALAPTTDLAMQGLMNSPGHKANILSPNFHKIGIGVIDGGIYGKMFTQEFTD